MLSLLLYKYGGLVKEYVKSVLDTKIDPGSSTDVQKETPHAKDAIRKMDKKATSDDVMKARVKKPQKPKIVMPVNNYVTSQFNWRRLRAAYGDNRKRFHSGVDFSCWGRWGAPVKSPEDGVVVAKKKGGSGITYVAIKGKHSGMYLYLMHCGNKHPHNGVSPLTWVGHHVKAGQVVGYINSSGRTTGPHLHFTVYTKNWTCVDPVKCYFNVYAPELAAKIRNYEDCGVKHPNNKTGVCG